MKAPGPRRSYRPERLHERVFLGRQAALILAAGFCFWLRHGFAQLPPIIFALTTVGLLNGVLFALHRAGRVSSTLEFAQVAVDVGAISVMVWSSGGVASPFYLLYMVEIPAAAISLARRGAYAAVVLSLVGYLAAVAFGEPMQPSPLFWLHLALLPGAGWLTLRLISRLRETLEYRAAAAAHEIKNSVHVIGDLLGQVGAAMPADEPGRRLVHAAIAELQTLAEFSQRLYEDSRPTQPRPTPLQPLVRDALLLAGSSLRAAAITHELRLPARPIWIRADVDAMRHSLLNLLLNVAEHAPIGGHVRIGCTSSWWQVRLTIEDSAAGSAHGGGDPVGRDPHESWGLGLRVTRELLMKQGARLETSAVGAVAGRSVSVVLPALALPGVASLLRPAARLVPSRLPAMEETHADRA